MREQLPNKGKTPSCHLRKCCREEGGGRWGRGAWREIDRGDRGNEIMWGKQDKKGNVEGRG